MTQNDQAAMNEQLTQLRLQGLSIDGDNRYKQDLIDAIIGAMMFGAQGANPPPASHWLEQFYVIAREERDALARVEAERDSFRAVLEGAEYGNIEDIPKFSLEQCRLIGRTVGDMTKSALADRDLLRDQAQSYIKCGNDLLAERDAVEGMVVMLEENEWAEHAGKGPISERLETCITTLHNELSEANERADAAQAQLAEAVGLLREVNSQRFTTLATVEIIESFIGRHSQTFHDRAQAEQQEAQGAQAGDECKRPPEGWKCSRAADHQGPCAASKADPLSAEMSALELMQTWTGEDWSEMAERFPALAEQIEGARRAALATQPAAGEPEQQAAINADDLPTKKYPLGAFDFDAPVAVGEPVAWAMWADGRVAGVTHHRNVADSWMESHDVQALGVLAPAAAPVEAGEPLLWQVRHCDNDHGWSDWEEVVPRSPALGQTVEHRLEEYRELIGRGYRYELRALGIVAPPAAAHGDEAVLKDAERYRWLSKRDRWASTHCDFDRGGVYLRHRVVWFEPGEWKHSEGQTLDEAIDAAMRAQAGEGGA